MGGTVQFLTCCVQVKVRTTIDLLEGVWNASLEPGWRGHSPRGGSGVTGKSVSKDIH